MTPIKIYILFSNYSVSLPSMISKSKNNLRKKQFSKRKEKNDKIRNKTSKKTNNNKPNAIAMTNKETNIFLRPSKIINLNIKMIDEIDLLIVINRN